ncbi:hypothetical protein GOP47_0016463 [Adiantum capillus-veneris]|uniref:Uncharacterized protein n=1 Tax=Adiantum capillus-veneris TaxID=13818 RepID=A0A9D4UIM3_ADICA|nr:hypothetical protein GOP47_0016463 [Adiantum capillus-veneris]
MQSFKREQGLHLSFHLTMVEAYNSVKLDRVFAHRMADWICKEDGGSHYDAGINHNLLINLHYQPRKGCQHYPKISCGYESGDGWGDLYDPDCEIEESQEAEIDAKCSGLTNLGNTRFMNFVLECLTYTVPFAKRILDSQQRLSSTGLEFLFLLGEPNMLLPILEPRSGRLA